MELTWKLLFVAMFLVVGFPNQAWAYAAEGGGGECPCELLTDVPDAVPDALGGGAWVVDVYYGDPLDAVPDGNVVVVLLEAEPEVWIDDGEPECDDPFGCSIGVVIYDPVDSTVLKVATVALLLERPWLKETIKEMCPLPPKCNVYYFDGGETGDGDDAPDAASFEGEGMAGDGWSEPVVYYPGDAWPLEAAIMLLLESNQGVISEIGGLCPCQP